ncbi:MAG TPA: sigma-54 dependent transcriptional regulator [Nitrospira sp.]|nr:sigma-54 dependent transcriptional regulator [Nitrospira sp.]
MRRFTVEHQDTCNHNTEGADSRWKVVLWESQTPRLRLIERVVTDCGARPYCVEQLEEIEEAEHSSCCAAVVALGMYQTDDTPASKAVGCMKQVGLTVIAHERGARSWPVGLRCRALLAGASCVLDSEEADFGVELQRILTSVLRQKTCEVVEKEHNRALMKTFGIEGESHAIEEAFRQAVRVASFSDLAVLITGESGTGKELMARAIHQLDPKRRTGPFVAINCGALSPGLVESELFGHSRGAFTGAERDRKGLVRAADGGVLFLDEIGELGSDVQVKLLRVLQDRRVMTVGTARDVGVDLRVIAATNRNLELMMQRAQFREDLFHRLNMLSVHLPPLRERVADLEPLIDNFLVKYRFSAKSRTSSIDRDFLEALAQLDFPGNVRQLENIVRRALVNKVDDTPLNLSDLSPEIWRQLCEPRPESIEQPTLNSHMTPARADMPPWLSDSVVASLWTQSSPKEWNLARVVGHCERMLVEEALRRARGNHSQAARALGITPRTLYNKLKKHHLLQRT